MTIWTKLIWKKTIFLRFHSRRELGFGNHHLGRLHHRLLLGRVQQRRTATSAAGSSRLRTTTVCFQGKLVDGEWNEKSKESLSENISKKIDLIVFRQYQKKWINIKIVQFYIEIVWKWSKKLKQINFLDINQTFWSLNWLFWSFNWLFGSSIHINVLIKKRSKTINFNLK